MKRVLVAGSTGYLGGFVCRELKVRGHFIRALARSSEKLAPLRDSVGEIVEADVGGPQTMIWREAAKVAFKVLRRPAKVTSVPQWLMWTVVRLARLVSRHQGERS